MTFSFFFVGVVNIDLKRNDYTPDKIIFPQDEPSDLTLGKSEPGNSTKESESTNSIRLML